MSRSELPVSMPPDPNTKTPGWTLPKGACDTHAHVFGPPHIFPYYDKRRYTPPAAPVEHYRNMQKITGLSRAVFVCPTAHGYDNRVILDAVAKLGDSARGIANINSSEAESLQALAEGGIRGARFHLMKDRPGSVEHLSEHLPALQKLGWLLVLHVDPPDFIEHERFIRTLPTVTIIDHMARVRGNDGLDQPAFRILLDLLKDDRFWVKLCSFDKISSLPQARVEGGLPFLDMVPFAQAVIAAAPDRVIWGTDWPHGNTFTPGRTPNEGDLLDLLAVIAPDQAVRHRILVDNPARLFGFAPN
jgi:predicted TIM-barrel fold metal-dependent hydrolase